PCRAVRETLPGEDSSLRWIYLHMIEEYARHNGHADFLREQIDGLTGEGPRAPAGLSYASWSLGVYSYDVRGSRAGARTDGDELGLGHRRRGAAPAVRGRLVEEPRPSAHTGLGEDQLDAGRRLVVAGDLGHHAADLLVPGHRQERR